VVTPTRIILARAFHRGRQGIDETVDPLPTRSLTMLAKDLIGKPLVAGSCDRFRHDSFDQHHPTDRRIRTATVLFFRGRDLLTAASPSLFAMIPVLRTEMDLKHATGAHAHSWSGTRDETGGLR
jgi:hypothetical protein